MKKIFFIYIVIILLTFYALINNKIIAIEIINNTTIFINKIFPYTFISMILLNLFINVNGHNLIDKIIKQNKYSTIGVCAFIFGLISGCPMSATLLENSLTKNEISIEETGTILSLSTSASPFFIIGSIGQNLPLLPSIKILISIYLSSIFLSLLTGSDLSNL